MQNVEFPLLIQGRLTHEARRKKVADLLERVGLTAQANQKSNELSGGQRQRVAIARALVTTPSVVMADEPTANLDSTTGDRIIELMKELNHSQGTTFIFSTHDPSVMSRATRIIRLKDGAIVT
jgi:putative ABC transport system ATP-binding protein